MSKRFRQSALPPLLVSTRVRRHPKVDTPRSTPQGRHPKADTPESTPQGRHPKVDTHINESGLSSEKIHTRAPAPTSEKHVDPPGSFRTASKENQTKSITWHGGSTCFSDLVLLAAYEMRIVKSLFFGGVPAQVSGLGPKDPWPTGPLPKGPGV